MELAAEPKSQMNGTDACWCSGDKDGSETRSIFPRSCFVVGLFWLTVGPL